jgi:iron complex transport system ATP-binding protein
MKANEHKAIELHSVSAGYGDDPHSRVEVLHDVSLAAAPATVTAILGPNGVGKTTLLNTALGWIRPWRGSVSLSGRPLAGMSGNERGRLVSLVPQADHIPFEYTVLEYVLLGRAPYIGRMNQPTEHDLAVAMKSLVRVGIDAMADHGVLETSAGERQLVLLARSLAQEPSVLLLDEPSAHLDLANKRRAIGLLRGQADAGRAVIFTAHEPEFAAAVADRIVLLFKGRVLADGAPADVLTAENLSILYRTPVTAHRIDGRLFFSW